MNITFAIGSRANFGSCRAVIERLRQEHNVSAIAYGTAILERYGNVASDVERICPIVRMLTHVEGGTPEAAGESSARALSAATSELSRTKPDLVFVVGDRYEVGPVAYAAHLLGIPIAHVMGGETSGTIDDKIRHSITQLATWHFVATQNAAKRVQDMIGGPGRVFVTGCPRIDIAKDAIGYSHECGRPYIVVAMHPDVDCWEKSGAQMTALLDGVDAAWSGAVHLFWPCADPGAELIVQAVRDRGAERYVTHRNMPDIDYYCLLKDARCAVGNSSSFIREGAFLQTPVVLVGNRQNGRERAENVGHWDFEAIETAISLNLKAGPPPKSTLYGSGDAAEKIAEALSG